MRLYRGIKEPYAPEKVGATTAAPIFGTDFTDCPHAALLYATGRRGVVLVLDLPARPPRVTEESWPGGSARRLMVWGRFDKFIVATVPAKELRARVRQKGIAATSDRYKSEILKRAIDERLVAAAP